MSTIVSRGGDFLATFKAAATLATLYEDVYLNSSGQVAACATITNIPIGVVYDKSDAGANSAVLINLFTPTRKGIARGVIASGDQVGRASTTSGFIACLTAGVQPIGVAVSDASATGEYFEFIAGVIPAPTIA